MTDYVARATVLAPRIAEAAEEIERERRLPAHLLAALHDAGMFRLLLPRSLGGAEIDPLTFARVVQTVAMADGSTAWCLCQNTVCSIVTAWLPVESAVAIFAAPDAVLAWGPGPARAQATPGGYRVTGRWSFASGGRHATWLGAHCPVFEADGTQRLGTAGAPIELTVLFPASAAPMTDIWQVVGLRGTASDAYAVDDLFVPEAFTVIRDVPETRREPGPLYAMSTHLLFAAGFAGVALGLARGLLDALIALASQKTPRGYKIKLGESALAQAEIATAEARWRAAQMYLMGTLAEIWQGVERTNRLDLDQRMALRLAATHTIHEAVAVADAAYHAAGATAIFERNPFERRFRDIHSVAQQVQGRRTHFESVGRHLLGFATDLQFV
jgi:indole-3-acetate monooxygenase